MAQSKRLGRSGQFFICVRDRGHTGQHVAEGHMLVLAVWAGDATPAIAGISAALLGGTT